jgi:alkylation response protein AidB-like acyl-CoA dehydrogenase
MHFAFTDEQEALRRSARQFLTEYSSSARVRKAMASPLGYDPEVWQRISQDLGWPALIIPEEYGGAGGTYVDLAAIMEETGRALLCSPFFSTVCLATNAILIGGSEEQKRSYLPRIAAGELIATVALAEAPTDSSGELFQPLGTRTHVRRAGDQWILNGTKSFVIDGHAAELLLVLAHQGEEKAPEAAELTLLAVPSDAPGVERQPLTTMDATRRQATLTFRDVHLPLTAAIGTPGKARSTAWAVVDRAIAALAAEQVGGAERCLEMATDYAKTRVQFNRPIGSFQAIKHKCADMLLLVESARSAAYYAAWSASQPDEDNALAAAEAKVYCSDAYFQCASENVQIHGGVGFTWEYDAHLYFKRAQSSRQLLGSPDVHRQRMASRTPRGRP